MINFIKQGGDLGIDLDDYKKANEFLEIGIQKRWMRQLLSVINFLASQLIIHRDIKPSNIFVAKVVDGTTIRYDLKLGDFGLARELG